MQVLLDTYADFLASTPEVGGSPRGFVELTPRHAYAASPCLESWVGDLSSRSGESGTPRACSLSTASGTGALADASAEASVEEPSAAAPVKVDMKLWMEGAVASPRACWRAPEPPCWADDAPPEDRARPRSLGTPSPRPFFQDRVVSREQRCGADLIPEEGPLAPVTALQPSWVLRPPEDCDSDQASASPCSARPSQLRSLHREATYPQDRPRLHGPCLAMRSQENTFVGPPGPQPRHDDGDDEEDFGDTDEPPSMLIASGNERAWFNDTEEVPMSLPRMAKRRCVTQLILDEGPRDVPLGLRAMVALDIYEQVASAAVGRRRGSRVHRPQCR